MAIQKMKFSVEFEFKDYGEAVKAHKEISEYTKNITGINKTSNNLYKRTNAILALMNRVNGKIDSTQIHKRIGNMGVTLKTTQRDLMYMLLKGMINHEKLKGPNGKHLFWKKQ